MESSPLCLNHHYINLLICPVNYICFWCNICGLAKWQNGKLTKDLAPLDHGFGNYQPVEMQDKPLGVATSICNHA
jgi:hypothetical protein